MSELPESTFQRCPHDRENPWVQINRNLIRDRNLNPEAKWLIIYLLSHKEGFNISIPYILKDQKISKDKMYRIVNECLEAGYLKREEYLVEGKKRFKYFVSEFPKFKNILLCPEIQDPEIQDPENQDTKLKQSSSSLRSEEVKIKQYKKGSAKPPVSAEAEAIYTYFLEKLRLRNPGFKTPNENKWKSEIDCILHIDNRPANAVYEIIDWAHTHRHWKSHCLSPQRLRNIYDEMYMQKCGEEEKELVRKNRNFAMDIRDKHPQQLKAFSFTDKYVINRATGKDLIFDMNHEAFKIALVALFGGEYVRN